MIVFKFIRNHKKRTILIIIAIAISLSFPISVINVIESAQNSSFSVYSKYNFDDLCVYLPLMPINKSKVPIENALGDYAKYAQLNYRYISYQNTYYYNGNHIMSAPIYYIDQNDSWYSKYIILSGNKTLSMNSIVISDAYAKKVNLHVGSKLSIYVYNAGNYKNYWLNLTVSGIVHIFASSQFSAAFLPLNLTKMYFNETLINSVGIRFTKNIFDVPSKYADLANNLKKTLGYSVSAVKYNIYFYDAYIWKDMANEVSRLFSISIIVALASVFALMNINLNESIYDIGVLRAIGFSKFRITLIFLFEILFLLPFGILFGIILSYLITHLFAPYILSTSILVIGGVTSDMAELLSEIFIYSYVFNFNSMIPIIVNSTIFILIAGIYPLIISSHVSPISSINNLIHSSKIRIKPIYKLIIVIISTIILTLFNMHIFNISFELMDLIMVIYIIDAIFSIMLAYDIIITFFLKNDFRLSSVNLSKKFIISNRQHFKATIFSLAFLLMIVISSNFSSNYLLWSNSKDAYLISGGDIKISLSSSNSNIDAILKNCSYVSSYSIIKSNNNKVFINNVDETTMGKIHLIVIHNISDFVDTIYWENIENGEYIRNTLYNLLSNDSVILSENLKSYITNVIQNDTISLSFIDSYSSNISDQIALQIYGYIPYLPGVFYPQYDFNLTLHMDPFVVVAESTLQGYNFLSTLGLIRLKNTIDYIKAIEFLEDNNLFIISCVEKNLEETNSRIAGFITAINFVILFSLISMAMIIFIEMFSKIYFEQFVYGIYQTVGFSKSYIFKSFIMNGIILTTISSLVGLIAYTILYFIPTILSNFNLVLFSLLFESVLQFLSYYLFASIISVISCIFVYIWIRRKNIVKLLSEELR